MDTEQKLPQDIKAQLTRDEGCKSYAYQDSLGYWTIGVGRLIDKRRGGGLSQDEIDYLLENDLRRVHGWCTANIPFFKNLDDARQGVLLNMCFNLRTDGLLAFPKMLAAIEQGNWTNAAKHLLDSKYTQQVGPRAQRLAQQLLTGQWQ